MSLVSAVAAASDRVNRVVEGLLLAIGIAFTVILFIQVVARYLGSSLHWSEEVGRYLLVATTFLGATVAYKKAHFVGLAGFGARFGVWIERAIVRGLQLLTLGCFGVITWFGTRYVITAADQTSTAVQMPMAIPIAVVPIAGAIFFLHVANDLLKPAKS